MTDATETKEETKTEATPVVETPAVPATPSTEAPASDKKEEAPKKPFVKREFKKNRRPARRGAPRSEFDQKILAIRRVTRVSAGGRRFSFSVAMAIGNGKGKVGVGTGKATDTALAIEKAVKSAKKNMIDIKVTNDMSIPHEVGAKFSSAVVKLQPSPGRGLVTGSAIRDLAELGGLKDVAGKVVSRSKNKLNIAKATIKALETLNSPKGHEKGKKKESDKSDKK